MPYANINLEGRLVNDPEIKTGKDDRKFCTFRMVVNQNFGAQENASFFNITGGEAAANRISKAGLTKGRMIHVTGNLTLREYATHEGETRISADVGLLDWHYADFKPKADDDGNNEPAPAVPATGSLHEEQYINDPDDLPL